tara:strand:+ start:317 stop:442 length:126 start_codon:yes stop_codon:yes gene_type:complete
MSVKALKDENDGNGDERSQQEEHGVVEDEKKASSCFVGATF